MIPAATHVHAFLQGRAPLRANPEPAFAHLDRVLNALELRLACPAFEHLDEARALAAQDPRVLDGDLGAQQEFWERCATQNLIPSEWLEPTGFSRIRYRSPSTWAIESLGASDQPQGPQGPAGVLIAMASLGPSFVRTAEALARQVCASAPYATVRDRARPASVVWHAADVEALHGRPDRGEEETEFADLRERLLGEFRAPAAQEVAGGMERQARNLVLGLFRVANLKTALDVRPLGTLFGDRLMLTLLYEALRADIESETPQLPFKRPKDFAAPAYLAPLLDLYALGLMPGLVSPHHMKLLVPCNRINCALTFNRVPKLPPEVLAPALVREDWF